MPTPSPQIICLFSMFAVAMLDLLGILWILQGTNTLSSASMAGHLPHAALGIEVVIFGVALLILTNRRSKITHLMG